MVSTTKQTAGLPSVFALHFFDQYPANESRLPGQQPEVTVVHNTQHFNNTNYIYAAQSPAISIECDSGAIVLCDWARRLVVSIFFLNCVVFAEIILETSECLVII